jgi:hypothetical protein
MQQIAEIGASQKLKNVIINESHKGDNEAAKPISKPLENAFSQTERTIPIENLRSNLIEHVKRIWSK